ncbi:hypothetical protein RRG08_003676 [Elysia crispata]|uniref:Uncharacterized protein n=1 Tax=Elysia crispata TaxID=231223 RepID=A0AAE1AV04_9GAST|nr:hypothetical protein RRG08_003676 [Elysia crispata]
MATCGISNSTTLIERLLYWRDTDGDTDAFVFYGSGMKRSSLTRKELVDLASKFAYILKTEGIGYKDVVANTLSNSLERAVTDMGIILAGAAPINAIPSLTSGENFFSSVRRSQAKAVIVYPSGPENSNWVLIKRGIDEANPDKDIASRMKSAEKTTKKTYISPQVHSQCKSLVFSYRSEEAPTLTKAILVSRSTPWQRQELPAVPHFLQFLRSQAEQNSYVERAIVPSDNGFLFTTTGTTGMQKIVPRSHSKLLTISQVMGQMTPGSLPSMFYTTKLGWNSGFPYMFYLFGSSLVMLDEFEPLEDLEHEMEKAGQSVRALDLVNSDKNKRHIGNGNVAEKNSSNTKRMDACDSKEKYIALYDRYWCVLKKESIRFAYLSPMEIDGIATAAETAKPQESEERHEKLLLVVTGGLPIKHNIVSSALKSVSHAIIVGYGMTEAGVVSFNMLKRIEDYTEGDCGRLFHGVQCRITDDAGNILPPGHTGNLEFKTGSMFEGFLNNVENTGEAFTPDGWFISADLGLLKPDGTVTVVCRKGNVILYSSVVVYPTAIEIVLRKCHGVKDVVVVPVPDKIKHHKVCACVIKEPGIELTEAEVQKSMDDLLAVPRGPELVTPHHVLFVDSFPLVQNLKIDRKKLEKMAAECISNLQ